MRLRFTGDLSMRGSGATTNTKSFSIYSAFPLRTVILTGNLVGAFAIPHLQLAHSNLVELSISACSSAGADHIIPQEMYTPNGDYGTIAAQTRFPLTIPSDQFSFRIFDLPRELRDNIYDHALIRNSAVKLLTTHSQPTAESAEGEDSPTVQQAVDEVIEDPTTLSPGLQASVKFRPCTNILRSSKIVRQEYGQRARQAITLVLKDNEHYSFQHIVLPEQVKEVYWAEFHLILFCHRVCHHSSITMHSDEKACQAAHEVSQHKAWIEDLLSSQLPKLRSLSVHVHLCYDKYKLSEKRKVPCESFVQETIQDLCSLPKLRSLVLFKNEFSAQPDFDGPKVVLFRYPHDRDKQPTDTTEEDQSGERAAGATADG